MNGKTPFPRLLEGIGRLGAVFGVLGVLALATSIRSGAEQFYEAYLGGWVFWMSLTVGCYGLMLLQNMLRAQWGVPVIRIFEAGAKMMPFMGIAFIPIIAAAYTGYLYPWADPNTVSSDLVLRHRAVYLNPFLFMLRNVVYFTVFSLTTLLLTTLSRDQDRTGNPLRAQQRSEASAPSFVIMVLLVTFGITDWVMSLDKHWYSTIYGFWFCIGSGLFAMAFATLLACRMRLARIEPYNTLVNEQVTKDFGNLLLMMTLVWAYFSVSQYLITWSGNLSDEITYYIKRNAGLLAWVSTTMVIIQFFIPFLLLLSGKTKRRPTLLISVCLILILGRIIESAWNVIPMFHGLHAGLYAQFQNIGYYIAAWVGIGGLWLFAFVATLRRNPLVPVTAHAEVKEVLQHAS